MKTQWTGHVARVLEIKRVETFGGESLTKLLFLSPSRWGGSIWDGNRLWWWEVGGTELDLLEW